MKAAVLVVDDEKNQREMLGRYLRKKGYEVHLSSSGFEALDVIKENTIEILITDQKMPKMNGLELAEKVKKN